MSATPPIPLVCTDGSLVWFDTLDCVGCLACEAFVACVERWAQAQTPAKAVL